MALLGVLITITVVAQLNVFGRTWDVHTMIAGALLTIVGSQVIALGLCARAYGVYVLGERDPWFDRLRPRLRLEHGLLAGALVMLVGLVLAGVIVGTWGRARLRRSSPRRGSRSSPRRS